MSVDIPIALRGAVVAGEIASAITGFQPTKAEIDCEVNQLLNPQDNSAHIAPKAFDSGQYGLHRNSDGGLSVDAKVQNPEQQINAENNLGFEYNDEIVPFASVVRVNVDPNGPIPSAEQLREENPDFDNLYSNVVNAALFSISRGIDVNSIRIKSGIDLANQQVTSWFVADFGENGKAAGVPNPSVDGNMASISGIHSNENLTLLSINQEVNGIQISGTVYAALDETGEVTALFVLNPDDQNVLSRMDIAPETFEENPELIEGFQLVDMLPQITPQADNTNVRSGPSINDTVASVAGTQDTFFIFEQKQQPDGLWYKISAPESGTQRWIKASVVNVGDYEFYSPQDASQETNPEFTNRTETGSYSELMTPDQMVAYETETVRFKSGVEVHLANGADVTILIQDHPELDIPSIIGFDIDNLEEYLRRTGNPISPGQQVIVELLFAPSNRMSTPGASGGGFYEPLSGSEGRLTHAFQREIIRDGTSIRNVIVTPAYKEVYIDNEYYPDGFYITPEGTLVDIEELSITGLIGGSILAPVVGNVYGGFDSGALQDLVHEDPTFSFVRFGRTPNSNN